MEEELLFYIIFFKAKFALNNVIQEQPIILQYFIIYYIKYINNSFNFTIFENHKEGSYFLELLI